MGPGGGGDPWWGGGVSQMGQNSEGGRAVQFGVSCNVVYPLAVAGFRRNQLSDGCRGRLSESGRGGLGAEARTTRSGGFGLSLQCALLEQPSGIWGPYQVAEPLELEALTVWIEMRHRKPDSLELWY